MIETRRTRACVVELAGPAGAGKSTLARALAESEGPGRRALGLWGLPRRLLLKSAAALAAPLARAAWDGRPLRPAEATQMARLGALERVVDRAAARGDRLVVLDEGPVFALAWFDVFFGREGHAAWERWRAGAVARWAERLDAVVRLDAPDPLLAARIRTRVKPHPVKHDPDGVIFQFSDRFRRAFDRVVTDLMVAGRVTAVQLETDGIGAGETVALLRATMERMRRVS